MGDQEEVPADPDLCGRPSKDRRPGELDGGVEERRGDQVEGLLGGPGRQVVGDPGDPVTHPAARSPLGSPCHGGGRHVEGGHGPPLLGQPHRVPALTTAEIENVAGGQVAHDAGQGRVHATRPHAVATGIPVLPVLGGVRSVVGAAGSAGAAGEWLMGPPQQGCSNEQTPLLKQQTRHRRGSTRVIPAPAARSIPGKACAASSSPMTRVTRCCGRSAPPATSAIIPG